MANALIACLRNPDADRIDALQRRIEAACRRLTPDNLSPGPPDIVAAPGLVRAVYPASNVVLTDGPSACLGFLRNPIGWSKTGQPSQEGSFVMFRADSELIEVVSDVVASRTAWYYLDDEMFAASTSQRALISLVGSYEMNHQVIPWIVATGSLGPADSWDTRLRRVPADTTVTLSRRTWRLAQKTRPVVFSGSDEPAADVTRRLRQCLTDTLGSIHLDYDRWWLPLSGGLDSRTLLYLLPDSAKQNCITWGDADALDVPGTDADVAHRVAAAVGANHKYLPISSTSMPIDVVTQRFIAAAEGRIDHLSGYLDGFALWKALHDGNVSGIIRGDTVFTARPVKSEQEVIRALGLSDWNSHENVPAASSLGLSTPAIPENLRRAPGESLEFWRDRLMRCFRIPVVIAALNQLKSHYVEIANPLLCREISDFHATLPDILRTDKQLLRSLFDSGNEQIGPSLPFARYPAIKAKTDFLNTREAVSYLKDALRDNALQGLVADDLIDFAEQRVSVRATADQTLKRRVLGLLGTRLSTTLRRLRPAPAQPLKMNFNLLAFRLATIGTMSTLLSDDAMSHGARDD